MLARRTDAALAAKIAQTQASIALLQEKQAELEEMKKERDIGHLKGVKKRQ